MDEQIIEAAKTSRRAMILTQNSTRIWQIWLWDGTLGRQVPFNTASPITPEIADFALEKPAKRGVKRKERPDFPLPLRDAGAKWLARLGWPVHQGLDPLLTLAGCVGYSPMRSSLPSFIGEERIQHLAVGFMIANGKDFYGLWEQDSPDEVMEKWPMTRAGGIAAVETGLRLILDPILDASILEGERYWVRLGTGPGAAAIAHWHPRQTLSIIDPIQPRPRTRLVSGIGAITLASSQLARYDPRIPCNGAYGTIELTSATEALQAARAVLMLDEVDAWQRVPDSVPRELRLTCAWVEAAASS